MAEDVRSAAAPQPVLDGSGLRVAIVAARFNSHITLRLLEGARRGLAAAGVADDDITVTWCRERSRRRSLHKRWPPAMTP